MNVDGQRDTLDVGCTETVDLDMDVESDAEPTQTIETVDLDMDVESDAEPTQTIETVDLDMVVESDAEPTQTEYVTEKANSESKPEEEIALVTLTPKDPNSLIPNAAAHLSTSNMQQQICKKHFNLNVKGGSKNLKKLVPVQVKGHNVKGTMMVKGTIMVSEEQITALMQKQKTGMPIALALPKSHINKNQLTDPKNNLTIPPEVQQNPLPVDIHGVMVSRWCEGLNLEFSAGVINSPEPPVDKPLYVCAVSPQTANILQNTRTNVPAVQSFTTTQGLTIDSIPSSLMYPNSTITSQNSTRINLNLGRPTGSQNVPSSSPKTSNINVLPQNLTCRPTVKTIAPKTVITPSGITNKFVVRPTSVGTTPFTVSSSNSQPRFLLTKVNAASNKNHAAYKLKIIPSPSTSGGNLMATKSNQNGTPANQSLPSSSDASKTNEGSNTAVQFPLLKGRLIMPRKTRDLVIPRVQPDGNVTLEKRTIPWDKKDDEMCKKRSQFTLSEVSNNPLESGVVKKFVVAPIYRTPASSSPLPQKTVQTATLTTANTAYVINVHLPSTPPPCLPDERPGDIRSQSPEKDGTNSSRSMFKWHHPFSDDSPNTMDDPVVAGGFIAENDPVDISDDVDAGPPTETSSLVAEVTEPNNGTVCISDDDEEQIDPTRLSRPSLAVTRQLHFYAEEHSVNTDLSSPRFQNDRVHSIAQSEVINVLDPKSNGSSSGESNLQWQQPCTGAEAPNPIDNSAMIEDSSLTIQNEAPPVKFQVKSARSWYMALHKSTIKKKKNKKTEKDEKLKMKKKKARLKKNASRVEESKTDIRKNVSSSFRPTSPSGDMERLSVRANSPSLGGNSFQWHHPSTDADLVKAAEKSEVVRYSELKSEPVNLPDSNGQEAHEPSSTGYGHKPVNAENTAELKYSPRFDADPSVNNDQDFPRIEFGSIHSVTALERVTISSPFSEENRNPTSCSTEDKFPSTSVANDKEEIIFAENSHTSTAVPGLKVLPTERNESFMLNKMQMNLRRRLKAKAECWSAGCATVSKSLKRVLVGDQDKSPPKIRKKVQTSTSTTQSNKQSEQIGNVSKLSTEHTKQKESSGDWIGVPNVLRDCIVRKTIQDCYLEGIIPTIDKIHDACCDSGLELHKALVEPHLMSIGYSWVKCKSQRLLLEDHQSTAERIKYLSKLKKYQGKNLVYIFVSESLKKYSGVWQVSLYDVMRPSRDAARVVLHAMSSNHLLEGGLEVLELGLLGLRHNDIISWLKCNVIPNIPQGSVVIFGPHPVFSKEETDERPNIGHSKEEIVSWLTTHKVTSVNPNLPKALLLCKVNHVILPKTSIFDKFIRQHGFVSLHLPKHHMDLNPVEFIWRDILEKLYKTPEKISLDNLQDFVAREFSSCSQMMSSVACSLVRKFGCSYGEFDSCSDELFEKLLSDTGPTDAAQVVETAAAGAAAAVAAGAGAAGAGAAQVVETPQTSLPATCSDPPSQHYEKTPPISPAAKKTTRSGNLPFKKCLVCLGTKRFVGYRCSACKNFWYRLKHDYEFRRQTGATLPVCEDITHIDARPPDCVGCRRHRYELALFHQLNIAKKRPQYVLPIPPVTEIGKKHWSKNSKKCSQKSSNLSSEEND